jgi:iron complex transport system ATP-binding protein
MSSPALEVRDLTFGYRRGLAVLHGVSFAAPEGSIMAVLGPNGAGKSSLLHAILGLLRPWAGEIRFFGKPLAAHSRRVLSRTVGLVPQREHVPFAFRVEEYLLLGRSPYLGLLAQPQEADFAAVDAALSRLGIAHLRGREVASLSGGEHQLVLMARALVQGAAIMLMDEPSAHLDLGNKHHILALMQRLAQEGHTIVLSTHDPHIAAHVADRVLMLRRGEALFFGAPQEALTADRLSALYGTPLRVVQVEGRLFVLPQ